LREQQQNLPSKSTENMVAVEAKKPLQVSCKNRFTENSTKMWNSKCWFGLNVIFYNSCTNKTKKQTQRI